MTQGLDNEICSIYRISIQDNSYSCSLNVSDGDIEPKVLVPVFRMIFQGGYFSGSDGAAVMQGFDSNRELPDGYEGGTNSTIIAYFMSSDGKLTRLPAEEDFSWLVLLGLQMSSSLLNTL